MTTPADGELETAGEMLRAQAQGEVTAVELVERALRRAEQWQPWVNAFSQIWRDDGESLLPAPAAPVAVKDLFDVAGRETTGCCAAYRGTIADRDAPTVERARARFLPIGKTNQHELAAGGTNLVSACGRPGNPWDPARMTGGSSGGSAAAVATGIVPVAFGSDTGGSIRIPASMCGTFGLKPTTGRLPLEGLMPLAPSMDCPGPLASTAGDLWLLYEAMAAAGTPANEPADPESTLWRIAVLDGFFDDILHDEVREAVAGTARTLDGAGVRVEVVDGRGLGEVRSAWMDVCCPEFARSHPLLKDPARRRLVSPQPLEWLERGERLTPDEQERAVRRRDEVAKWYRQVLNGFDAALIPTTPYPAPRADESTVELGDGRTVEVDRVGPGSITCSVNLAGLPALSIPAGRSLAGMPIGISLVGHQDGEPTLLRLAALWERAAGYRPAPPPLPSR
jgi:aspartyl-tRNA(Asn)/glutamyl-tRNA(Gln) amidotransferase subunit A